MAAREMIAFAFVVLLLPIGGAVQSEAFDYDSAIACERKREAVIDFLLTEGRVMEFYVGPCQQIRLVKKT